MSGTGTRKMTFSVTYREVGALATIELQRPGKTVESRPYRRLEVEQAYIRLIEAFQQELDILSGIEHD